MHLCTLLLFLFFINNLSAQNVDGRVIDSSGVSINAATIFIKELNQGLISDRQGRFQISLQEGDYTFICKYPGYKEMIYNVSLSGEDKLHCDLVIEKDSISGYGKDLIGENIKADSIIRNCIKKAPAYHNSIMHYKANSYIKGNLVLNDVSNLMDRATYRFENIHVSDLKGEMISQEIYNNIEYYFPETYKIKIDGQEGYIPENLTERGVFNIQKGSVYSEWFCGFISPLNRSAFRYYKYKYEGYYTPGELKVHKIKVEPKMKDTELLSGYLYITDSLWTVEHIILHNDMHSMKSTATITYYHIQDNIYLPVSYHNDINFGFMGTGGAVEYYSGLKYNEFSDKVVIDDDVDNSAKNIIAFDAGKRDGNYWDRVRLQPVYRDSSRYVLDTMAVKRKKFDLSNFWIGKIILGGYIAGNDSSRFSLKYNGVKMVFRDYNYVDGFWLGNKFDMKLQLSRNTSVEAYPYIYYTTARKRALSGSDIIYNYFPKKRGQLTLSLGSRTEDFNNLTLTRYQNYFNSLVLGENHNFFYQRDYISISNNIHLNKKIRLSASLGIEKRSGVSNHTDFNIFGRNHIKPNIFPDDRFDRTFYSVGLSYSPRSNYSITEALDMYKKNITPVFNIEYQEGFSSWQTNNSKYRKLKGGFSHKIQLDYFNSVDYKIEAGTFITRDENMHFTDYQHFGASDMLLNLNSLFDSFLLLDNYELQTNEYWVNLFLNYSGKYVLLKFIPFLQGKPFTENLHLKTLFTPEKKSYVETGYSLSFTRYFGIGTFVSFHNTQGRKFGVRLSLNLRSLDFI
jgi:hypothetical protein